MVGTMCIFKCLLFVVVVLSATRASAICSSTNVTGRTFTSVTGTIVTDSDGNGWRNYYNNERCLWTITCPSSAYQIQMTIMTKVEGCCDYIQVSWRNPITTSERFKGSSNTYHRMYDVSTIDVSFYSDGSINKDGATVSYVCEPFIRTCGADDNNNSTAVNATGTFMTDSDGDGSAASYTSNEYCVWSMECPPDDGAAYQGLLLSVSANIFPNDAIWFYNKLGSGDEPALSGPRIGSLSGTASGTKQYEFMFENVTALDVVFDASATDGQGFGFTLNWTCVVDLCFSPNATGVGGGAPDFVNDTSITLVGSDVNSDAPQTIIGQRCAWNFSCPLDESTSMPFPYVFVEFTNNLLSGNSLDQLLAFPVNDTTSRTPLPFSSTGTLIFNGSSPIVVETGGPRVGSTAEVASFTVPTSTHMSQWEVNLRCTGSACSVNEGGPIVGDNGVLQSGNSGYELNIDTLSGERCVYEVACSSNYQHIALFLEVELVGWSDSFVAFDYLNTTDLGSRERKVFSATTTSNFWLDATNFSVTMFTSSSSRGFRLRWQCSPTKCLSPDPSVVTGNDLTVSTIRSDTDGYSSGVTPLEGDRCTWTARCPSGSMMSYTYRGYLAHLAYLEVYDPKTSDTLLSFTGSTVIGTTLLRQFPFSSQDTELAFNFIVPIGGYSSSLEGFTFDFYCRVSECTGDFTRSNFTNASGLISSDQDGPGASRYRSKMLCPSVVECPGNYTQISMFVQQDLYSSLDSIVVYDGVGASSQAVGTFSRYSGGSSSLSLVGNSSLVIFFFRPVSSTTYSSMGGAWVYYTCGPHLCISPNSSVVNIYSIDKVVSIFSDPDGAGSEYKSAGSSISKCTWRATCPVGSHVITTVRGRKYSSDIITMQDGEVEIRDSRNYQLSSEDAGGTSAANWMEIGYQGSASSGSYSGLTFDVSCRTERCSARQNSLTGSSGEIVPAWSAKSNCTWSVRCPYGQGYDVILYTVSGSSLMELLTIESNSVLGIEMGRSWTTVADYEAASWQTSNVREYEGGDQGRLRFVNRQTNLVPTSTMNLRVQYRCIDSSQTTTTTTPPPTFPSPPPYYPPPPTPPATPIPGASHVLLGDNVRSTIIKRYAATDSASGSHSARITVGAVAGVLVTILMIVIFVLGKRRLMKTMSSSGSGGVAVVGNAAITPPLPDAFTVDSQRENIDAAE